MPYLEMFEVQEHQIWTRVKISKEQAKRYKEYQNGGDYPDWVDEIDWDEGEKTNRAGNDSVISVKVIEE